MSVRPRDQPMVTVSLKDLKDCELLEMNILLWLGDLRD